MECAVSQRALNLVTGVEGDGQTTHELAAPEELAQVGRRYAADGRHVLLAREDVAEDGRVVELRVRLLLLVAHEGTRGRCVSTEGHAGGRGAAQPK